MAEDEREPTNFDDELFFITPIGDPDTPVRSRADGIQASILEPVAAKQGLTVVRADQISDGGNVTIQVLEHCVRASVAVGDLTGNNPNVYYEVGIRHALRKPTVLIADNGTSLPFDLLQQRTIFYVNEISGVAGCVAAVQQAVAGAVGGTVDSPVEYAERREALVEGDSSQRALADVLDAVERLSVKIDRVSQPSALDRLRSTHRSTSERLAREVLGDHLSSNFDNLTDAQRAVIRESVVQNKWSASALEQLTAQQRRSNEDEPET